uniref:Uncharacterized protein n=1 Tax=Oryza punctata TaxID=4537 RepID=A0A0E0KEW7_ORYPU
MAQRALRSASSSPTPAAELHLRFHPLRSSNRVVVVNPEFFLAIEPFQPKPLLSKPRRSLNTAW